MNLSGIVSIFLTLVMGASLGFFVGAMPGFALGVFMAALVSFAGVTAFNLFETSR